MNLHDYYDTVMQLSHGIVVTLDLDGRIIHGNAELENLSGYPLMEMAGRDWFETFMAEDEREAARAAIFNQAREEGITAMAGSITSRDGDIVYIDWHLKPLRDSVGEVVSILCVGKDVTDHMLREKGLERERFTLMERNKELDCLYRISQVMADMEQDLDVLLENVVGLLPGAFQNPARTHVRLELDIGTWETPVSLSSGSELREPVMVNKERRGALTVTAETDGFIDVEKDLLATAAHQVAMIIAKKETRQAKQALEHQLMQADRLAKIGQFSAGVAHEINEPLANILGFAELAMQTPHLPEQVMNDLGSIRDSSLHAREIIRKLMFFGRQLPPQLVPVNLNEVAEQGLQITEAGARRADVTFRRDYDESLPPIMADPQHIKQVVVNLVANAIQAMETSGTVTVSTFHQHNDAYLIVEDDGPGMKPNVLKQIFTPFYTTKDVNQGTGLGLSVVHGIVKGHDGFIQVDSAPGQGTRVEVVFPCPNCNKADKQ